jgi:hypothetical protein
MTPQPDSPLDRRALLIAVTRGAVAVGAVAASVGLLARRGRPAAAPCGAAACNGCPLLTGCRLRAADSSPPDRRRA